MKDIKIKIHWSFFILGILMIIFGRWTIFLWSILAVVLHEMGHSAVGKHLGYKLNIITLMPYGANLSGSNAPFSDNDEIKIAIAGPFVNAALIVLFMAVWWIFPSAYNYTADFVSVNIYTLLFNILPVYPLDGGRILTALLSKKISRTKVHKIIKIIGFIITSIFFVLFFVSIFYKLNYMLGINALFLLIGLLDDDTNAYYEKLTTLEKFKPRFIHVKFAEVSQNEPLFLAYKKVVESGAKQIVVKNNEEAVCKLSKNDVINLVLNNSIDVPIKNVI